MRKRIALVAAVLFAVTAASLSAHDMFVKLDNYFLQPGDTLRVPILNGTFTKSSNGIEFERVKDLQLLTPEGFTHPAPLEWMINRSDSTTQFGVIVKKEGTYAVGLSTKPRELAQTAKAFNAYLKEEGITDILERRKRLGQMNYPARERYSKNVKAVFQVGEARTPQVNMPFGAPAEIVPLDNPYVGNRTGSIRFLCLVDGKAVPGMTVLVGSQLAHEKPHEHALVTDAKGEISVKITKSGRWYVKFVRMTPHSGGEIDYESKWATLTFQVR
jgi:uncharacterized GH25 family protein